MDLTQVASEMAADQKMVSSEDINGNQSKEQLHRTDIKHMLHKIQRIGLIFAATFLACIVLYHAAFSLQVFSGGFAFSPVKSHLPPYSLGGDHKLENVLLKASMPNKTVILTTLNEAWAAPNSVFDLFLKSFRIGKDTLKLLDHLVVITMDDEAYKRCIAIHPHCYHLPTKDTDFSAEAGFQTPVYLKMMWRRIEFLGTVIDLGYSFVFTDTDIMWFRNPFPRFYSNADFQIACDFYRGNPSDMKRNLPNGGFTYVKSNKQTSKFYKFWYKSRVNYPGLHDQDVLNKIKSKPYIKEIGLRIKFLDTAYFGGFCEPSRDLNRVCTMHANCCVGLSSKIYDLNIILGVWQNYLSTKNGTRKLGKSSWNVPNHCKMHR